MMIQIKVSPRAAKRTKAEPKKKQTKKKTDAQATGVAGAQSAYPLSTNVSSPIRAPAKRLRPQFDDDKFENEYLSPKHANGYQRDDFVVVDDEGDTEDEEEAFEPVRPPAKSRPQLSTPITMASISNSLSPNHEAVAEDFVTHGKKLCNEIMIKKSLRQVPFTDTMLREMAVKFITTEEQMLRIPYINPEMVRRHGKQFMELVKKSKNLYESMERDPATDESMVRRDDDDEPTLDPNHKNVINLVSDDEDEYGSDLAFEDEDEDLEVSSSYFKPPPPDVASFTARMQSFQRAAPNPAPKAKASTNRPNFGGSGSRSNFKKGSKKTFRKKSDTGAGPKGVPKRRSNVGSAGSSKSYSKTGRHGGGGGNGSGIGMMPT
jgi:bloom syndrome protein